MPPHLNERSGAHRSLMRLFTVCIISFGSVRSDAAVSLYRQSKTQIFDQTSDAQPTVPSGFYGGHSIDATSVADLSTARVNTTQSAPPREYVLINQHNGSWANLPGYSSLAAMNAE